jgi:hypothetical protein
MTTLKERVGKNPRILIPVALGIVFASVLIVSLITETFPFAPELESTTLVWSDLYPGFDNEFLISAVENILGEKVITGWVSIKGPPGFHVVPTGFYLKAPVKYDETIAGNLENYLSKQGPPEDAITVMELGPWISSTHIKQIILAVIGALVALSILSLFFHRRRRVAWSLPFVICLNIIDTIGLVILLRVPFGIGSLLGVFIVFIHTVNTNILLISRMKTGEDLGRKAKEAAKAGYDMTGGMMIFFVILATAVEFPELIGLSAVVVIGSLVNLLNTSWLSAELLKKKAPPIPVKSHVSL